MDPALGQAPDQPGLHSSEQEPALLGTLPRSGHIVQDPFYLRAGKVGVDHQTGLLPEFFRQTLCLQRVAVFRGPAALPDNSVIDRLAGFLIPDDGSLALVCDADRGNVRGGDVDLVHRLYGDAQLACPDLVCVVLHPSGLGKILGELSLCDRAHFPLFVKEDASVAGCPCIQRHDIFRHFLTTSVSSAYMMIFSHLQGGDNTLGKSQARTGTKFMRALLHAAKLTPCKITLQNTVLCRKIKSDKLRDRTEFPGRSGNTQR